MALEAQHPTPAKSPPSKLMEFAMYGYDAVLAALRAHARDIKAKARLQAERDRVAQAYAEYVLRN
ncbi:MAG TPA: hypothetical protein VNE82_21275, partial [Candidatus Binataceae bacterium]|nr:hypothetical protein [Candidatus Binataceae bacterium]